MVARDIFRDLKVVSSFEEKVEISRVELKNPPWIGIGELEVALKDNKKPDYILLTSMRCQTCLYLHHIMEKMSWTERVLFINMDEEWVKRLTRNVNIKIIPTLLVTLDGGGGRTVAFAGLESVATALFEQFNKNEAKNKP